MAECKNEAILLKSKPSKHTQINHVIGRFVQQQVVEIEDVHVLVLIRVLKIAFDHLLVESTVRRLHDVRKQFLSLLLQKRID